jgi:hypothetical protein
MIKDLPIDLLRASQSVLDINPLDECYACGAVVGNCVHTDTAIAEDTLSAMDTPDDESEAPDELSGKQEEIIVNPEYQAVRGLRNNRF